MTREQIFAIAMPVERRGESRTPNGKMTPVVYRYRSESEADTHLRAEAKALEVTR